MNDMLQHHFVRLQHLPQHKPLQNLKHSTINSIHILAQHSSILDDFHEIRSSLISQGHLRYLEAER